jgi:ribosomal protein L37AE/L43A
MIGATALHTRAPCDECGDVPATREDDGGIIVCARCDTTPAANDDVLGALLGGMLRATPLCSRCSQPAFLRVDGTIILCAECWLAVEAHLENDSSFAVAPISGENVTAAGSSPLPTAPAAVTLIPQPAKAGGASTVGARPAVLPDLRAPVEPAAVEVGCGQAPESNSSSCGDVESGHVRYRVDAQKPMGVSPILRGPQNGPDCAVAGVAPGPQDSITALPQGGSPVTVGRLVPAPAVTPIFSCADPSSCCGDLDAIVSDLEAGWDRDRGAKLALMCGESPNTIRRDEARFSKSSSEASN